MSWNAQTYFNELSDGILSQARTEESATLYFRGEASDFVRFNAGRVRQAGHVLQQGVILRLIRGLRQAAAMVTLSGILAEDSARLTSELRGLRDHLGVLPDDPHTFLPDGTTSTERVGTNELPVSADAVSAVQDAAGQDDLVGIFASGPIGTGFANSNGQRNWFDSWSYNLDWSLYLHHDKAVKSTYAGTRWESDHFEAKMQTARQKLNILGRPAKTVDPGHYRVYLAPPAVSEIMDLIARGGFSVKAHRTKRTPLLRMVDEGAQLSPLMNVSENTADGLAPDFQEDGVGRPADVPLIQAGAYAQPLVSPRSAREYGLASNGATIQERPESMDIAGGALAQSHAAEAIGTGVYIGNLWYLNYSDRSACRTTGMTRFATFWVEDGEIQAPLDVMRFDESVYRALGENLVGLTEERDLLIDPGTYGGRSAASFRAPGALVDDFAFTL